MSETPRLLRALAGETLDRPPIWFMRQAGRSLPEYRELRTRATGLHRLLPQSGDGGRGDPAAHAALPDGCRHRLRRHPADPRRARPGGLVRGRRGAAARRAAATSRAWPTRSRPPPAALSAIGETLSRVRAELEPERALIGFAGGPWTVATYMIEGRGSRARGRRGPIAYEHPEELDALLRRAGRGHGALPGHAGAGPAPRRCRSSRAGPRAWPRTCSNASSSGRTGRIVEQVRAAGVDRAVHRLPARAPAPWSRTTPRPCRCEGVGAGHPGQRRARPAAAGRRQDDPGRARQPAAARRRAGAGRPGRSAARAVGRRRPTSSTSATASSPTPRSRTSPGWSAG